jgi:ATP-dependent DNA helicase RecQ
MCTERRFHGPLDPELVQDATTHIHTRPIVLEVKKVAPGGDGRLKKIDGDLRAEEGRALGRLADEGWYPLVESGRSAGRFDDELLVAVAHAVRSWKVVVEWVTAVPSLRSGPLVPDLAERLATMLGLAFAPVVERVSYASPQREMANAVQQVANVRGAFKVNDPVPEGPCLLLDDLRFSGWTLATVAGQLRQKGAGPVFPFALASAF